MDVGHINKLTRLYSIQFNKSPISGPSWHPEPVIVIVHRVMYMKVASRSNTSPKVARCESGFATYQAVL